MPKVVYHYNDATAEVLDVEAGTSLMRAAVQNGVRGIIGECGGQAMCATCHVYVRHPYIDALPDIGEDEDEMLDDAEAPRTERSRLGCQVELDDAMPEVHVDVPQA